MEMDKEQTGEFHVNRTNKASKQNLASIGGSKIQSGLWNQKCCRLMVSRVNTEHTVLNECKTSIGHMWLITATNEYAAFWWSSVTCDFSVPFKATSSSCVYSKILPSMPLWAGCVIICNPVITHSVSDPSLPFHKSSHMELLLP